MKSVKVSDWSQPYKLAVYAIAIIGFGGFIYFAVIPYALEIKGLLEKIVELLEK